MDNLPNTEDVQEHADQLQQRQQTRRNTTRKQTGGAGFNPDQLGTKTPETASGLYWQFAQGQDGEQDNPELSTYVSAGNLDPSELRVMREKERSIAMLSELEEKYRIDLQRPKTRLAREINFMGQSSKGKYGFMVRAPSRQEQVAHQEQMHSQSGPQQEGPGMMQKLKKMFGGAGQGDTRQRINQTFADPGDFGGVGVNDRSDDIW